MTHPFDSARTLLNFFWPGSFPDPLHLPFEPEESAPEPKPEKTPEALDLAGMEKRIIAAVTSRRSDTKREFVSPFLRRKEAIQLLKTRSVLEACERAGWLEASTRRAKLVLYPREQVMACVWRLSQGEYP